MTQVTIDYLHKHVASSCHTPLENVRHFLPPPFLGENYAAGKMGRKEENRIPLCLQLATSTTLSFCMISVLSE